MINIFKKIFGLFNSEVKKEFGINTIVSDEMDKAISLWNSLYTNNPYWLSKDVKSLNLGCYISRKIARLVTIEMKTEVTGSARAEYINAVYKKMLSKIRETTEFACAKGGLVFKPFYNGKLGIECIHADKFFPTEKNSEGEIVSAVFAEQKVIGEFVYTRLEHHKFSNNTITITNKAYKGFSGNLGINIALDAVAEWSELMPEVIIHNVQRPLFCYFKMPLANNIDFNSPLGVSVFSGAVDLIKAADEQYSRLLWEFEGSELAIYVDETALEDIEKPKIPKMSNRIIRMLNAESSIDAPAFFEVFSPEIRQEPLTKGLNVILQKIEDITGLSRGTLSDPNEQAKTATELHITEQTNYVTVADIQKSLEYALIELVDILDIYCSLYNLTPKGNYEISFKWDDSIITDRDKEYTRLMQMADKGYISKAEFLAWYFDISLDEAKKKIPQEERVEDYFK